MVGFVFRWSINHLIFFRKLWKMRVTAPGVKLLILYDQQSQTQMILQSLEMLGAAAKQPNRQHRQNIFWQGNPSITIQFLFFLFLFACVWAGRWQASYCTADSEALPLRKSIGFVGIALTSGFTLRLREVAGVWAGSCHVELTSSHNWEEH